MKINLKILLIHFLAFLMLGCSEGNKNRKGADMTASEILGNPEYQAISYGGYRKDTREIVPSVEEIKNDMRILSSMRIKLLRTYNTQQYKHTANLLEAIKQLKDEDPDFEMYVMLGTWIECKGAWTDSTNRKHGNIENNTAEIAAAVKMANAYPDIVKIIAVGNEAMVHWAAGYFVFPEVILKWVKYLKEMRDNGEIPSGVWITSSDNFASWGGGSDSYKTDDLVALIKAVDYISMHTYPFHDTHYNPNFWEAPDDEEELPGTDQIEAAMLRAREYAVSQYQNVKNYLSGLGIEKPIHIGETGWASLSGPLYGAAGSRAADEYKQKLYYDTMRDWTNSEGISCFYFEAFDESWKDPVNVIGSENHFGLINLKGEAKFIIWEMVDKGVFDGLSRNGVTIKKTYNGDKSKMMENVLAPPIRSDIGKIEK